MLVLMEKSIFSFALAAPPSPSFEAAIVDDDENEDASMQVNISCVESRVSQPERPSSLQSWK